MPTLAEIQYRNAKPKEKAYKLFDGSVYILGSSSVCSFNFVLIWLITSTWLEQFKRQFIEVEEMPDGNVRAKAVV